MLHSMHARKVFSIRRPLCRCVSSVGLIGMPNVGKSTLFNALVGMEKAQAANYPFCTIEPNIASVVMPDPRLEALSRVSHSERCVGIQVLH